MSKEDYKIETTKDENGKVISAKVVYPEETHKKTKKDNT